MQGADTAADSALPRPQAMESPEAQAQAAQMSSFMSVRRADRRLGVHAERWVCAPSTQNPEVQKRMIAMQDDPEMKDFFDAVKARRRRALGGSGLGSGADSRCALASRAAQTGGPTALMKFWNDEKLLLKISQKLGGAMPAPAAPAAPQKPPEVTNLLEACRWGDLEAAEDFIAIGKGVNEADKEGRTALCVAPLLCVSVLPAAAHRAVSACRHFAVAFGRGDAGLQIVKMLLESGAKADATDSKQNTTLHYACG